MLIDPTVYYCHQLYSSIIDPTVYYCYQLYLSISRSSSCEGVQKDLNVVRNVFTNLGSAYIWYVSRSISFRSVPPLISGISVGDVPVSSITMFSGLSFFANLTKQNRFPHSINLIQITLEIPYCKPDRAINSGISPFCKIYQGASHNFMQISIWYLQSS